MMTENKRRKVRRTRDYSTARLLHVSCVDVITLIEKGKASMWKDEMYLKIFMNIQAIRRKE